MFSFFSIILDWKSQLTLSTPTNGGSLKSQPSYKFSNTPFKPHHHINHPHHLHHQRKQQNLKTSNSVKNTSNSSNKLNCDTTITTSTTNTTNSSSATTTTTLATKTSSANSNNNNNKSLQTQAVQELSLRLLDELRAAKSRHLSCTEVSLPCDLTPRIALEILRLAREEPNGLRDCTIYIEFEDEPNNSRRIATLDFNKQQRSGNCGYEIYVTLSQDHRGWTALLPQFMKNLSRTITISPDFNITKHRPYSKSLC